MSLNQQDFAERFGVSRRSQASYEGGGDPPLDYLRALESGGIDVFYLLTGSLDVAALGDRESWLIHMLRDLGEQWSCTVFALVAQISQANNTLVYEETVNATFIRALKLMDQARPKGEGDGG